MSVKNYYGTLLYVLVRACQIVVEDRYCTEPRDVILCMIMRGFVHVRLLYHKPLLSSLNFQAGVARNVRQYCTLITQSTSQHSLLQYIDILSTRLFSESVVLSCFPLKNIIITLQ